MKTKTVTVRDTVLLSVPDSLYYNAYIDCVNNKPVLRNPEEKKTKGVKSDVSLKDGKLSVNVNTEAQKLYHKWKDKYIEEHKFIYKEKPVPYPVIKQVAAEFTKWQNFYLGVGKSVFFGFLMVILFFLIKLIPWKSFLRL